MKRVFWVTVKIVVHAAKYQYNEKYEDDEIPQQKILIDFQ